jgi:hypothetical protein
MNIAQIRDLIPELNGCIQVALTQRQIFVGLVSRHKGREEFEAAASLSGAVSEILQYIVAVSNKIKALMFELRRLEAEEYDKEKKQKITDYIVKLEKYLALWDAIIDSINKGIEPEIQWDEEGQIVGMSGPKVG